MELFINKIFEFTFVTFEYEQTIVKKFPMCRILTLADIRPSFLFSGMHSKTKLAIYNYTANKYMYMERQLTIKARKSIR